MKHCLLLAVIVAAAIAVLAIILRQYPAQPRPDAIFSQGPTIERLEHLAHLVTMRVYIADVLVGEGEGCRGAWLADAMAPSILFIDELDKGLSGVASSGQTDSGVSARLFGYFLSWLNDHESDVFVVATCNDISRLPPEFSRSERFDGIFFVDLPGAAQKRTIWRMYVEKFGLDATQPKPVDADWSGAEIRSCCRLSALLDVPLVEAAQNVVPVARTAYESVERLRTWASGRCLSADLPGIYTPNANAVTAKPGRRVRRDPSNN